MEHINASDVGRRVRMLRLSKQQSQAELAQALGISRPSLTGIEVGRQLPTLATAIAIADAFHVPLDWLLGRAAPTDGPLRTRLVYRPDELEVLRYWDLLSFAEKQRLAAQWHADIPSLDDDTLPAPAPAPRRAARLRCREC